MDKDGDGHLTPSELHAALRNTGALAKAGMAADIDPHVLEVGVCFCEGLCPGQWACVGADVDVGVGVRRHTLVGRHTDIRHPRPCYGTSPTRTHSIFTSCCSWPRSLTHSRTHFYKSQGLIAASDLYGEGYVDMDEFLAAMVANSGYSKSKDAVSERVL